MLQKVVKDTDRLMDVNVFPEIFFDQLAEDRLHNFRIRILKDNANDTAVLGHLHRQILAHESRGLAAILASRCLGQKLLYPDGIDHLLRQIKTRQDFDLGTDNVVASFIGRSNLRIRDDRT